MNEQIEVYTKEFDPYEFADRAAEKMIEELKRLGHTPLEGNKIYRPEKDMYTIKIKYIRGVSLG